MEVIVSELTTANVVGETEEDIKVPIIYSKTSESGESDEEIDVSMFGESSGLADAVLIIEGTSIPVVKSVLSVASPVFKVMFTGDFAEKSQKRIEQPGKDLESFLSFLQCIYPDQRDRVKDDTVFSILPLASEYQVQNLTVECENCLVWLIRRKLKSKQSISCDETCKYLNIAERFHLDDLKQLCIRWIANFKLDTRTSAFKCHEISDESKSAILTTTCKRHEQYEADVSSLHYDTNWKPKTFAYISSKLRLAYTHFGRGSDEYKKQIVELKPFLNCEWEDYCLRMPEDILEDLRRYLDEEDE